MNFDGVEHYSVLEYQYKRLMIKFASSAVTVTQRWDSRSFSVILTSGDRTAIATGRGSVEEALEEAKRKLPYSVTPYPVRFPKDDRKILRKSVDSSIMESLKDPSKLVSNLMNKFEVETAGAVDLVYVKRKLITSGGFQGEEEGTYTTAYFRAFHGERSGSWAWSGNTLDLNSINDAVKRASHYSQIDGQINVDDGKYNVILSPMVFSNLMNVVGWMSSAMAVELGNSIFMDSKIGSKVGSSSFTLSDSPRSQYFGTWEFDDEGVQTYNKPIVNNGVLSTLLYNRTLGERNGGGSTGNAGWIFPRPWSLEVGAGSVDEGSLHSGGNLLFNNNWYTRMQNYVEGTFSTVGRDAIVVLKDGKEVGVAKRLRIADSIRRIMENVEVLSKQRYPIRWWEVETPTLSPFVLVKDVHVTRAS
jgi:PmbA protein